MDSNTNVLYSAAGLPALISTGITFIYFFLKACHYVFHAISHQLKGGWQRPRQVVVNKSTAQIREKEGHTEVCEQIPRHSSEQYGGGDPKIPRVHFSTKKEARHMPPFPWRCSGTYRRVHFLRKCKKTARQKASKSPRH